MLFTFEMIANMGFNSAEAFLTDYIKKHPNCCYFVRPNGIWCDYDTDS